MTYLQFLLIFLLPPIAILTAYFYSSNFEFKREFIGAIFLLCFLALAYTTPWDNYLVATNVWSYPMDRIVGTIGYVPIEEYCFFILQTIMSGLWCFFVCSKLGLRSYPLKLHKSLLFFIIVLSLEGLSLYALLYPSTRYLGLILAWGMPIVFLQLLFGFEGIRRNLTVLSLSLAVPTLYLWLADAYAISVGIWTISPEQTTGFHIFGLPVEEAIFFLITNVMVVQGVVLFAGLEKQSLSSLRISIWKMK